MVADFGDSESIETHHGDWRAFTHLRPDTVIVDHPFGKRTHEGARTMRDIEHHDDFGGDVEGIRYPPWTPADVEEFGSRWAPITRRWIVAMTSHDLIPAWEATFRAAGMYAFAPVPAILRGMTVRRQGDGPSSWTVFLMAGRHRDRARMANPYSNGTALWRATPGGYHGGAGPSSDRGEGRGKPLWLPAVLVRDYSNPGDLVVDPMMGWGSTLRAASALGRSAIGIEIDAEAHRRALVEIGKPFTVDMETAGVS